VGRSTFQFDNLEDKSPMNYYVYSGFSKNIQKWNVNVGGGLDANGNIYYNLTNGELNRTQNSTYSGNVTIRQNIQKKYDFYVTFGPSYTFSRATLQQQDNNNGWGMN